MRVIKVGALFAGVGAIEMALAQVAAEHPGVKVELAWYCEVDKAAAAIMAHHHPGVPNLGDVTKVDWHSVPKVDVITGGSPCQDLSHAGKRKGMTDGTRSNLWVEMREAIAAIRPRLVVWENVRGALSAAADSDLEPCAGCVGGADDGPVLRALGRVLGDLAELGYDARWYGLRAADVGAPHGRFRIFLFATPADANGHGLEGFWRLGAVGHHTHGLRREGQEAGAEPIPGQLTLLPTPAVNDMGAAYTPETWDAWTDRMKAAQGDGNGHGKSLAIEAQRLLPTPVADNSRGLPQKGTDFQSLPNVAVSLLPTPGVAGGGKRIPEDAEWSGNAAYKPDGTKVQVHLDWIAENRVAQDWREYEPAIRRWEHILGRPAPAPTEPGAKGQPRLSPAFVEFLMGLPEGHVTDPAIGISRNDQLKALGNGVVPQQCAAATRAFIRDTTTEAVAS